jgi:hypothetical protein
LKEQSGHRPDKQTSAQSCVRFAAPEANNDRDRGDD